MKKFSGNLFKTLAKYGNLRRFSVQHNFKSSQKPWERDLGQPSNFTHPRLIKSSE